VGGPAGGMMFSPLNTSLSWAVPSSVANNSYELTYFDNKNFSNSTVIGGLTSNSAILPELSAGKPTTG
jgi:hypothetical protein